MRSSLIISKAKYWIMKLGILNSRSIIKRAIDYYWSNVIRYSPGTMIEDYPYVSPNVWEVIQEKIAESEDPKVFEYGSGASSLWHIQNLVSLPGRGSYTGVEHKLKWHDAVIQEVTTLFERVGISYEMTIPEEVLEDGICVFRSVAFCLFRRDAGDIVVNLVYAKPKGRTDDGTADEFDKYIGCLRNPVDICIVDGRARVACVNHVLDKHMLTQDGWLILLEAGRGMEGYLNSPAMKGTYDYRSVVQRMISSGGIMVDGIGIDRWDSLNQRRVPGSSSQLSLKEACFMQYGAEG